MHHFVNFGSDTTMTFIQILLLFFVALKFTGIISLWLTSVKFNIAALSKKDEFSNKGIKYGNAEKPMVLNIVKNFCKRFKLKLCMHTCVVHSDHAYIWSNFCMAILNLFRCCCYFCWFILLQRNNKLITWVLQTLSNDS